MKIQPGVGVGSVKYGMLENDLVQLLGKPDKVDKEEYVQGSGDWHREL